MKTILSIMVGIGMLILFLSLNRNLLGRTNTSLSVLIDKTDSLNIEPDKVAIATLLGLEKDKWNGNKVKLSLLTDYQYSQSEEIILPGQLAIIANPTMRKREINHFLERIDTSLVQLKQAPVGRLKSNIYSPIIREANALAKQEASKKYLLVYSDLQENSKEFSIYKGSDSALISDNVSGVIDIFRKRSTPHNLTGLTVYFIYQAKTGQDDERFNRMAEIFKRILEEAGAEVIIGANLVHT